MWLYLTDDKYNDLLLSFNLVNTNNIKTTNRILYGIVNNIDTNYEEIIIHKKNNKLRFLYTPSKTLKDVQRKILKNILEERVLSPSSYAYKKNCSVVDAAKAHVDKKIIVKLDIKDFFNNITFNKVYKSCFNEDLFPRKMGILLTNLCVYNNMLPQGAPTSGYISNIILRKFDYMVAKYCADKNISYTRYSDDMTFSGDFNVGELIKKVNKLLYDNGFKLNKEKIKVVNRRTRQQVLGVVVNEKLSIRKNYKRKIRQEIYYINKFGLEEHLKKINVITSESYVIKLMGKINYVLQVEKNNKEFIFYKTLLEKLFK